MRSENDLVDELSVWYNKFRKQKIKGFKNGEKSKGFLKLITGGFKRRPRKKFKALKAVLTGATKGADLYNILYVIGKERALKRIKDTVKKYNIAL